METNAASRTRARRATVLLACASLGLLAAGCGEDDFANDPRPPASIELTAVIHDRNVIVSPQPQGAGPVTITISNQSKDPAKLTLNRAGPGATGDPAASSNEIEPGATGQIKTVLEPGAYEASAGASIAVKAATIEVGPERDSAQNTLLLP